MPVYGRVESICKRINTLERRFILVLKTLNWSRPLDTSAKGNSHCDVPTNITMIPKIVAIPAVGAKRLKALLRLRPSLLLPLLPVTLFSKGDFSSSLAFCLAAGLVAPFSAARPALFASRWRSASSQELRRLASASAHAPPKLDCRLVPSSYQLSSTSESLLKTGLSASLSSDP